MLYIFSSLFVFVKTVTKANEIQNQRTHNVMTGNSSAMLVYACEVLPNGHKQIMFIVNQPYSEEIGIGVRIGGK